MKTVTIEVQALDGNSLMQVTGKLFEISGFRFVVHPYICGGLAHDNTLPVLHKTLLQVTEYNTGCCFVKSYERQKYAIEAAVKRFNHMGLERVQKAISNFPVLNS